MLNLVICGAAGRMGRTLVRLAHENGEMKIAGAVEDPACPELNKDAGELAGVGTIGIPVTADLLPLLSGPVVVVEFSTPAATLEHARLAAEKKTPIVIGTTGADANQLAEIEALAQQTPVLLSANMSLGVNLLVSLMGKVAGVLGDDYDVEIIEAHHRFKKDAPSGTALALGRAVAEGLGRDLEQVAVSGRRGLVGERGRKEIALLSVRAGDMAGDHTVIFAGIGERLEFIHRAHNRDTFAQGALRAAAWLAKQQPGFYSMHDVLKL